MSKLGTVYFTCNRCEKTISRWVDIPEWMSNKQNIVPLIIDNAPKMFHKCYDNDDRYGYFRIESFKPDKDLIDIDSVFADEVLSSIVTREYTKIQTKRLKEADI